MAVISPRRLICIATVVAAAVAGGGVAGASSSWVTYHGDQARTGVDASEPSLSPLKPAWSNALDGASEYGQPVVAAGRVFVATEDDNVYALDAHDGHVLWHHNIGAPLTNVSNAVGCGDIDPLGITSTPVIDLARSTVFVVGEVSTGGALPIHHQLVGFNIYSGDVTLSASADPTNPGGDGVKQIQQRAALAVGNGRVYVGYGGFAGDCGNYSGWVVGVDETGARPNAQFRVMAPTAQGGAIWQGGAGPTIDSSGNVYVTTGNPNGGTNGPYAESVVKLTPGLAPLAHFQDPFAGGDSDLGTGDALLLPGAEVFAVGKTNNGYLLHQSNLTQVHSIAGTVCGSDPDGGEAYDAATHSVYVPCRSGGIQQVNISTFATGWQQGAVNGGPILVDGELWAAGYNNSELQQLNPVNGAVLQTLPISQGLPTFASPSSADGLLLLGTNDGVVAFDGPAGPPPPASPPPRPTAGYWLAARDGGVFAFGNAAFHGSLGRVRLAASIVGMAPTADGRGYWLVGSDGGVFTFGDAHFYGSTGNIRLAQPVVGIAAAPDGRGYWLVAKDGGVFAFGPGARFLGSTGNVHLVQPVVGMAPDAATGGYWLVAADGGLFSFHAAFYGSAGGYRLQQPAVGMSAAPKGRGYWIAARDGGVFAFGSGAPFYGSARVSLHPVVGVATDSVTPGYWLAASDGGVFAFHAPFEGSTGAVALAQPIVAIAVP